MDPLNRPNRDDAEPVRDGRAVLVAFGGRSPEHEVSILTALQAMAALSRTGLPLQPLYVTKRGDWLTGPELRDLEAYQDLERLEKRLKRCTLLRDPERGVVLRLAESSRVMDRLFVRGADRDLKTGMPLQAALLAFHGGDGESGAFQGLFQAIGLPYTGSDVAASSLGMDKARAKRTARTCGVPVVEGVEVTETAWIERRDGVLAEVERLGYPVIVKPAHLGSSIGIAPAGSAEELREAVEDAFRYDATLLVERRIRPLVEVNCAVLGDESGARASVCERPLGGDDLLSFTDKYLQGRSSPMADGKGATPFTGPKSGFGAKSDGTGAKAGAGDAPAKGMASASRIIPADISEATRDRIQAYAVRLFQAFGCSGVARFDFLLQLEEGDKAGDPGLEPAEIYFNEVNTIPGSFSFYLWSHSGLGMDELLLEVLSIAQADHRRRSGRALTFESNLLRHHRSHGSGKLTK